MEKNKTSEDSIKILNRRSFIIIIVGAILSFIVSLRLFSLQVINFNFYKKKSVENKLSIKLTPPLRGDIYDSKKNLLAGSSSLYEFVVFKNLSKDHFQEIKKLDSLINLKLNFEEISKRLKKYNEYSGFSLSRASWEQIVEFEKNKFLFNSIKIIESKKRYYPYQNFSQIIGYMGQPTLSSELYSKGVFHLEKSYEKHLKGTPGKIFSEVNAKGKTIREISIEKSIKGNDLDLTLDLSLQNYAQSQLPTNKKGSIVVISVSDGSILSMNSNPTFDAQIFEDRENNKIQDLLNDDQKPLFNRAFSGFYPPGSVFKPISALVGLQRKLIDPQKEVFCKGHSSLGDRNYYCWKKKGHGKVNLKKAIKESCDVYFYELAKKTNIDDIASLSSNLGLNKEYDIGLSNIGKGLVPSKKWKKAFLEESWYQGETLITCIGQGYNQTSPLQLATLYSAILNGGKYPIPKLDKNTPTKFTGKLLNNEHQKIIVNSLNAVVQEPRGTAHKLSISNPEFVKIGGKTGTSQVVRIKESEREDDQYKSKEIEERFKDHSVFVGYAPYDKPKYIASVIIENGGSGSAVAAPIAHKILDFAFKNNV
ncbi:penicillin-binding protein 2 [Alphaproteobacteria bacterium]|nr:penicillin-binding protein 2 [Alphaproteobacteria bacterium]